MAFAKNLCNLMQKRDISSYKLAKEIGVHTSTVSHWRDGKKPQVEHLKRVAEFFGVSLESLIT